MSEFGYIPEAPTQTKFSNSGIFTPSDIYDLHRAGKWIDTRESLVLLGSQTVTSATASVDFTTLRADEFETHIAIISGWETNGGGSEFIGCRLSNDGGSTYESGSDYSNSQFIQQSGSTNTYARSDTNTMFQLSYTNNTEQGANVVYFYNLHVAKHTNMTFRGLKEGLDASVGGGVYKVSETINALQFLTGSQQDLGTVSLYGLRG